MNDTFTPPAEKLDVIQLRARLVVIIQLLTALRESESDDSGTVEIAYHYLRIAGSALDRANRDLQDYENGYRAGLLLAGRSRLTRWQKFCQRFTRKG